MTEYYGLVRLREYPVYIFVSVNVSTKNHHHSFPWNIYKQNTYEVLTLRSKSPVDEAH